MSAWTVIGFWHDDTPVPCGVVEGDHPVTGGDDAGEFFEGPWAVAVTADTDTDAEDAAVAEMLATLAEEDE